jgi:ureidoacrylate peracid hydrolase
MHNVTIPDEIIAHVIGRRGRLHVCDELEPARCALIVVDLQNGFMAPGAPLEVPVAREIVPNVNALAGALRAAGGRVVWVQNIAEFDPAAWPSRARLSKPALAAVVNEAFQPGRNGYELWRELDVRSGDLFVQKRRYSAFLPTSSTIDDELRSRGIDTVIITGTVSNVCCESSARDAMMLGYNVVFVSDATAALSDFMHLAALCSILSAFGDVMTTDEVRTRLQRQPAGFAK